MDDTIFDKINDVDLKKTMEESYIEYAMSVIAARALPDVRDGLKPVQRRILYAMIELNNGPDKPHRKCARIVGDTMGKYHPHGDSSIYGALVNLAQDWSTRYPLIDGHGNFGSVDGDGAAAMRYTEARLSRISMEMLADINKDTVNFSPNFDETEREPDVLPSRMPNLLVNGTSGIAVGMATNIPPHKYQLRNFFNQLRFIYHVRKLGDDNPVFSVRHRFDIRYGAHANLSAAGPVCFLYVVKIIENKIGDRETTIEEVLEVVKGPDFPTGAMILGTRGIEEAYRNADYLVDMIQRSKQTLQNMGTLFRLVQIILCSSGNNLLLMFQVIPKYFQKIQYLGCKGTADGKIRAGRCADTGDCGYETACADRPGA